MKNVKTISEEKNSKINDQLNFAVCRSYKQCFSNVLFLMSNTIRMEAVFRNRTLVITVLKRNTNVRNIKPLLINHLHEKCQNV